MVYIIGEENLRRFCKGIGKDFDEVKEKVDALLKKYKRAIYLDAFADHISGYDLVFIVEEGDELKKREIHIEVGEND